MTKTKTKTKAVNDVKTAVNDIETEAEEKAPVGDGNDAAAKKPQAQGNAKKSDAGGKSPRAKKASTTKKSPVKDAKPAEEEKEIKPKEGGDPTARADENTTKPGQDQAPASDSAPVVTTPPEEAPVADADAEFEEVELPAFPTEAIAAAKNAHLGGANTDEDALENLSKACITINDIYSKNGSMAYWSEVHIIALQIAVEHNMLNRMDTMAAIDDMHYHEVLFSQLPDWLCAVVSCKTETEFLSLLSKMLDQQTDSAFVGRMVNVLDAATTFAKKPPTKDALGGDTATEDAWTDTSTDAGHLWRAVSRAIQTQKAPGYAHIRFKTALEHARKVMLGFNERSSAEQEIVL